jgi:hypothetical protein
MISSDLSAHALRRASGSSIMLTVWNTSTISTTTGDINSVKTSILAVATPLVGRPQRTGKIIMNKASRRTRIAGTLIGSFTFNGKSQHAIDTPIDIVDSETHDSSWLPRKL